MTDGDETPSRLGLTVTDLEPVDLERLGVDGGVRIVSASGAAAEAGMREGDVITKLDNQDVRSREQFNEIAGTLQPGRSVAVLVIRGQNPLFLPLRVPE